MVEEEKKAYVRKVVESSQQIALSYSFKNEKQLPKRFIFSRLKKLIDDFISNRTEERLILMPGIRGVGKTTLLSQIYLYLTHELKIPKERVVFLFVDEVAKVLNSNIAEILETYENTILMEYLTSIKQPVFLLLDEVHYDEKWAFILKSIYDKTNKVFTIATGSSALSLTTTADLARRALNEELYPLNFSEYLMLEKSSFQSFKELKSFVLELIFNPKLIKKIKEEENLKKEYSSFLLQANELKMRRFLLCGGFPFSPFYEEKEIYSKVNQILEKVINEDIRKIGRFREETINKLWRFLIILSSSPQISIQSLSSQIGLTKEVVTSVLEVLEKSKLLFSIKPLGGEEKIAKKAWRYYFATPTIRSSLKNYLGTFKEEDIGTLLEEYVATTLYRINKTKYFFDLFFDAEKGGANFIIKQPLNKPIPIEVKSGEKGEKQVRKSMEKFKSEYGIVIGGSELRFEENILYLPKELFFVL